MANLTGFSRLKNLFQGSLNLTTYREIISHTRTAECGNIPKDLVGTMLNGKDVKAAKNALSDASDALSYGIGINQRAQSIQLQRELSASFDKDKIISLDFLKNSNLSKQLTIEHLSCSRGIEDASKILTEHFSKIIPNCKKVEIKPLKAGSYGQGYKLEFLDSNGNKLIHDKVIKVFYKDGQTQADILAQIMPGFIEKSNEFVSQFTLRDIVTMWNNMKSITRENVMTFLKPFEEILTKQNITVTPEMIDTGLEKLKSLKLKDIKPLFSIIKEIKSSEKGINTGMEFFRNMQEHMSQIHGIYAEANTTMFLRNRVGHSLRRTNVVAPDYYNLKKGFSIAEYSDDLLPAKKSDVDFNLLGLEHQDLHSANEVAGRIIDIGGVKMTTPELSDKITTRYYKKIMNQKNPELRRKYIAQLEKEIELLNDLDKEKVKKAIRLAT